MNNKDLIITGTLLMGLAAGSAQAASISYNLNQSNAMPDGVDYLTVTISDSTTTIGDIDFEVVVNTANFPGVPVTDGNFGMDNFYFNYDNSLAVTSANIIDMDPTSWSIATDKNAGGGFGFFEFDLKGTGASRTETLSFTISGVDSDSIYSYAVDYEGKKGTPNALFAAHVGGYDTGTGGVYGEDGVESAKFATVVPVPAAVWLFGSGLIGLAGIARRRRA